MDDARLGNLSKQLDAGPDTTRKALGAAVPPLLAALTRNPATPEGASALHGTLERDHDGTLLDQLHGFRDQPDTSTGDGILGG